MVLLALQPVFCLSQLKGRYKIEEGSTSYGTHEFQQLMFDLSMGLTAEARSSEDP
jgi:hypothetical protein